MVVAALEMRDSVTERIYPHLLAHLGWDGAESLPT